MKEIQKKLIEIEEYKACLMIILRTTKKTEKL
jgi:hypothetical protein